VFSFISDLSPTQYNRQGATVDRLVLEEREVDGRILRAVLGDLTAERVDAIVNAANSMLAHGGGLAGAIVARGGPVIQQESSRLAPVAVGGAVVTTAGDLPCTWVIHAVGPRWGEGDEEPKLRSAVRSSLAEADRLAVRRLALPAISTGIFGYPKREGTRVIVDEILTWIRRNPETRFESIHLTAFDRPTAQLFADALQAGS
jgi:O-acetyl-ADP-ribose deacetylase (regulator of RNase III)